MTHTINMFDIYHPSQHLVFVFDAPKWLLTGLVSVPVLCFGMRKRMKAVLCTHCTLQNVGGRSCFPSYQGSKELLIQSLFFRPVPVVSAGITLLIMTS